MDLNGDAIRMGRNHNLNKDRENNQDDFIDFIERVEFLKTVKNTCRTTSALREKITIHQQVQVKMMSTS